MILGNSKYKMDNKSKYIPYYCGMKDHFLRVQFMDEDLSKVGPSNDDTSNHALYDRVYCTLRDGIIIGDKHYEFLAFSASQLRDHSCCVENVLPEWQRRLLINWIKGIPDEVFIELKDLRVRELDKILESEHTVLDFLQRHVDEYGILISLADLAKIRADKVGALDVTEILQENQIYCQKW
ncbi:hypothetical protein RhiirB3_531548 [Rhizophagus irregularis]|nr:hypothetical protein RhiirB3_531548 [Rhizophagus irregularis]